MVDLRQPYLTSQLIAYIGNKRALLPFIHQILTELLAVDHASNFADPFAGSGSVSRLARTMGLKVFANDWEPYTQWINGCHLGVGAAELSELFDDRGGIDVVLDQLNALDEPATSERYISDFYGPRSTETADYRTERMFYTAENARRIDAIRSRIEEWYPQTGGPERQRAATEKAVLIAALLHQAATHTNTSGVFKAYHKGFGGHSGDALKRIMAPVSLQRPVVIDAPHSSVVSCLPADEFAVGLSADICYLDPPYNQHQYGSNYHLLNTIGLWDRPVISNKIGPDGRLKDKAGIRKDWGRTRSDFCSRERASGALRDLLDQIDCPRIILSYNSDGVVSSPELVEILARHGRVTVRSSGYVKYRGGRQSPAREVHNSELLWIVDRRTSTSRSDLRALDEVLRRDRLALMARGRFDPEKVRHHFRHDKHVIWLSPGLSADMPWQYSFADPQSVVDRLPARCVEETLDSLESCLCHDRTHQIAVLLGVLDLSLTQRERRRYSGELVRQLRKLAYRKHAAVFSECCRQVRNRAQSDPERLGPLIVEIDRLTRLAAVRAAG